MIFYRYKYVQYAVKDMDGEFMNSPFPNPAMILEKYNLIKETPKGYWIAYGGGPNCLIGDKQWISKTSRKRFAYPTKKEAMTNFVKRTESRIKILEKQVLTCKMALSAAKRIKI